MILRTAVALLVSSAVTMGAVRAPVTRPASSPAATQHFPTPQELLEQIKKAKADKKKLKGVAYFDLSHPVQERPAGFSLFKDTEGHTLRSILARMQEARDDKDVKGVL